MWRNVTPAMRAKRPEEQQGRVGGDGAGLPYVGNGSKVDAPARVTGMGGKRTLVGALSLPAATPSYHGAQG